MVEFLLNICSELETYEIFANLIQKHWPVIPDNQLARGIKSKSTRGLGIFFSQMVKKLSTIFFKKWSNLHEWCRMCWNEWKIIFPFLFFEIWSTFYSKWFNFLRSLSSKLTITRILQMLKIGNLIFHSFQHIGHFLWKLDHNWVWGVCVSLVGNSPKYAKIWIKVLCSHTFSALK